jgi:hypothetical protein
MVLVVIFGVIASIKSVDSIDINITEIAFKSTKQSCEILDGFYMTHSESPLSIDFHCFNASSPVNLTTITIFSVPST